MHGLIRGVPPTLDLNRERALQRVLVEGAAAGLIQSAHDCAEGGLAITVAESCFDTGFGVSVDVPAVDSSTGFAEVATLFSESASRVVVSVKPSQLAELVRLAKGAHITAAQIGTVGGERIQLRVAGRLLVDEKLSDAESIWTNAIESYFEKRRAIA
jgi:phosphoribosylformylglycinamidine synthase